MMSFLTRMRLRRRLPPLGLLVLLFLGAARARAMDLFGYDLDSLVFMSSDIVEGKLVRTYKEKNLDLAEIQIARVHKGSMEPGKSVAVGELSFYRKGDISSLRNTDALEAGDQLILFLGKARSGIFFEVPAGAEIYVTAPSGLKLVKDDKVTGFVQNRNPGPYETEYHDEHTLLPSLQDYRVLIDRSIKKTDPMVEGFKAGASSKDIPWLLELLRDRPHNQEYRTRDSIAETAAIRLANLHDPEALAAALQMKWNYFTRRELAMGFGTPEGREFLLRKIGIDQESTENRVQFASAMEEAGGIYHSRITELDPSTYRPVGVPADGNAAYLTRMAQLALDNGKSGDLCLALLRSLKSCAGVFSSPNNPEMAKDIKAAMAPLKKLYALAETEQLRYEIELTMAAASREAYDEMGTKCGSLISTLSLADPAQFGTPAKGTLNYVYSVASLDSLHVDEGLVVLVEVATGRTYVLPAQPAMNTNQHPLGNSGGTVTLPKNLPHGKYRLHLQLKQGDKIVSEGHYFETDL